MLIFETVTNCFQKESSRPINVVTIRANVKLLKPGFPLFQKIVQPVTCPKVFAIGIFMVAPKMFLVPCKNTPSLEDLQVS